MPGHPYAPPTTGMPYVPQQAPRAPYGPYAAAGPAPAVPPVPGSGEAEPEAGRA
ncbi:hypothetical protein [Streptomyces sp. NBC_00118]|uniref:hypothetical protein n=1 Tax=unclassified Streptomyces TaxID=2593676 RepID=UPI00308FC6C0|nr:hypothetical protein OG518_26540 [Streptomyces sp. NBC_01397]